MPFYGEEQTGPVTPATPELKDYISLGKDSAKAIAKFCAKDTVLKYIHFSGRNGLFQLQASNGEDILIYRENNVDFEGEALIDPQSFITRAFGGYNREATPLKQILDTRIKNGEYPDLWQMIPGKTPTLYIDVGGFEYNYRFQAFTPPAGAKIKSMRIAADAARVIMSQEEVQLRGVSEHERLVARIGDYKVDSDECDLTLSILPAVF